MIHRQPLQRTEGQSIVLVALALLVLVAMAGLGLDGANAFNQRRNTANAADAASLAGTRVLVEQKKAGGANSGNAVRAAVVSYLNQHGLNQGTLGSNFPWKAYYVDYQKHDLGEITAGSTIPNNARGVRVSVQYTFNTVIMPVLGRNDLTVDGNATAIAGVPASLVGADLIPLAIPEDKAKEMKDQGGSVAGTLWDFQGSWNDTPGNFGSVNFTDSSNGNGNNCTSSTPHDTQSYWWCNGSQYPVYIGQNLDGNTGNLSGLKSDIQWRINNRPYALAPVFDTVSGNGSNTRFHVIGFLKIRLTDVDMTGNPKTIEAKFEDYITTIGGDISDPSLDPSDFDLYAINLVQ